MNFPQRVLLTGASGYIGHHVATALLNAGVEVHALTRPGSDLRGVALARHDLHTVTASHVAEIVGAVRPQAIVHLASLVKGQHAPADIAPLIEAHVTLPTLLLEAALPGSVFINTGSYWELGDQTPGLFSNTPNCVYAATKAALKPVLDYYARARYLNILTLTLFDVYGPNDWRGKLLPTLAARVKQLTPVSDGSAPDSLPQTSLQKPLILSPGEQLLDFVHIRDVAAGYMQSLRFLAEHHPARDGQGGIGTAAPCNPHRFALRSGTLRTLREVIALVQEVWNVTLPCEFTGSYPANQIMIPNISESILPGWGAATSLRDGLAELRST